MFGRAQRDHAGEGGPDAFLAACCLVDDQYIRNLLAQESEGGGKATLARADDEHVEHGLAPMPAFGHPRPRGVVEAGEIGADAGFEVRERHGHTLAEEGETPIAMR